MLSGNRISTSVKGFLIGGAVGSVITFLFTPKSGEELRKDIESGTKDYYKKAKTEGIKIVSETKDLFDDISVKAEQLRSLLRQYAENVYNVPTKMIENEIKSLKMALNAAISVYNKTHDRTVEHDKKVSEIFSEFDDDKSPKFEGMGRRNRKN